MNRRTMLGAIGASSSVFFGGCTSEDEEGDFGTLQRLSLVNVRSEPISIDLVIQSHDGSETYHDELYDLPAGFDGRQVDCVWPNEPLLVECRLEGGDWNAFDTTDYEDCLTLIGEANGGGVSYFLSHETCPIRDIDCNSGEDQ